MTTLLLDTGSILAGLLLLYFGAELLVRSSVSLGLHFGMSRLVIGMTVVAFSTSAPEIVVSAQAALEGKGDIALGNVFGSNLANIGLILGLSACLSPLAVHFRSVRVDGPLMVVTAVLSGWIAWDGHVGRIEAAVLLSVLAVFIAWRIRLERTDAAAEPEPDAERPWPIWGAVTGLVTGLVLLATGGDWLIAGALSVAARLQVPDAFIAVTVVAVGTSLPELSTSVVAALKGNADIAVGNILGSNIFNACGVLGLAALINPLSGSGFHTEIIATTLLGLAILPLLRSGYRIERWEGALMMVAYVAVVVIIL